jgi:hypothetical protein
MSPALGALGLLDFTMLFPDWHWNGMACVNQNTAEMCKSKGKDTI